MKFIAIAAFLLLGGKTTETTVVPSLRSPPKVITTSQDFRGAVLSRGEEQVQVEELQWGMNADDRLVVAYGRFTDDDGKSTVVDKRANVKRIFKSPSEMHGFFMSFGELKQVVWIEKILFARDVEGCLVITGFSGTLDDVPVGDGAVPAAALDLYRKCQWHAVTVCASGDPKCVVGCPSMGTCRCPGFGNCNEFGSAVCDGPCPEGQDCNTGSGGGVRCKCRPI